MSSQTPAPVGSNPEDRYRLWAAKLRGTISRYWPEAALGEVVGLPFGSAGQLEDGSVAWVLVEVSGGASVGGVVAWAAKAAPNATTVHVLVPEAMEKFAYPAPVWARLATYFQPSVLVYELTPSGCERVEPGARTTWPEIAPHAAELGEYLAEAELELVIEAGILRGEVLGLEVARVVELDLPPGGASEAADRGQFGSFGIDIGVGRFDQEISRMLQAETVPLEALVRTADYVRLNRTVGSGVHPLAQLCRERWLRRQFILERPRLEAHLLEPTVPRASLRQNSVCGVHEDRMVHVFTTGVDLDAVAQAADLRNGLAERLGVADADLDARLVFADSTLARVHERSLARLHTPIEAMLVPAPWG